MTSEVIKMELEASTLGRFLWKAKDLCARVETRHTFA